MIGKHEMCRGLVDQELGHSALLLGLHHDDFETLGVGVRSVVQLALFVRVEWDSELTALALGYVDRVAVAAAALAEDGLAGDAGAGCGVGEADVAVDHQRLAALRALLEDQAIDAHLRLAGCLVAFYAQPVAWIVRLTAADLQLTDNAAHVRLGDDPVALPPQLRDVAARTLQDAPSAQDPCWLFPGLKAGHPTHPAHLARRLRQLGVPVAATRPSAIAALAHRIPAPCSPTCSASARTPPPTPTD